MYKRILIPTDGSKLSRKAIKHGISLAKSIKAKVTAVTVSAPIEGLAFELIDRHIGAIQKTCCQPCCGTSSRGDGYGYCRGRDL